MNIPKKYDVILFDWDGTLINSMPLVLAGHNVVRRNLSLPEWTIDEVLQYATKSARENFPVLYGEKATEAETWFYDFVNAHRFDTLRVYDDTAAALARLKQSGFRMGVVSNKKFEYLRLEITHFGWDSFFETSVGAGEAPQDKPAAAPIHMALSRMGYAGEMSRVLYVGDTITDKDTAASAGTDWAYIHQGDIKPVLIDHNPPIWRGIGISHLADWLA